MPIAHLVAFAANLSDWEYGEPPCSLTLALKALSAVEPSFLIIYSILTRSEHLPLETSSIYRTATSQCMNELLTDTDLIA